MRVLATAVLLVLGMSPDGAQDKDKPARARVYVYTATGASGEHTPEEKGRLEAVELIREALRKKKIPIAEDQSQADVLVEVTEREQREAPMGGFGGKQLTSLADTIIRVHVKYGDAQSDLKGIGQGTWGRAAKDAADRIVKWMARALATEI